MTRTGRDYYAALASRERPRSGPAVDAAEVRRLRELDESFAHRPVPTAARADHTEYFELPLPMDRRLYIGQFFTARGLESGIEVFPYPILDWNFVHPEVQYCTGGVTPAQATQSDGATVATVLRPGSVYVIPAGCEMNWEPPAVGTEAPHANIYAMNGPVYYDELHLARMISLGLIDGAPSDVPGVPDLTLRDVSDQVETRDWSQLLVVDDAQDRQPPSWLRNGWHHRRETRLLDYHEGLHRFVASGPSRTPDEFLSWDRGRRACRVSPILAEPIAAVTDCWLPAGFFSMLAESELWHVLDGSALIRQSIPALHYDTVDLAVEPGMALSVAGGANVEVVDADERFVVRRLAASCAHNHHVDMMERQLVDDGIDTSVG
ncbi:MAG: hypothetical protein AAFY28_06645 [Actinomycetota bacterium]